MHSICHGSLSENANVISCIPALSRSPFLASNYTVSYDCTLLAIPYRHVTAALPYPATFPMLPISPPRTICDYRTEYPCARHHRLSGFTAPLGLCPLIHLFKPILDLPAFLHPRWQHCLTSIRACTRSGWGFSRLRLVLRANTCLRYFWCVLVCVDCS